jgi:uncharacterized damage-inducible protein DinB
MTASILEKLLEHNNWANNQIMKACATLSDAQLDSEPKSATQGSIRSTLFHLATSQRGYLRLLMLPVEERRQRLPEPAFEELQGILAASGDGLVALAHDEARLLHMERVQTTDGYLAEPWMVMVQIIDHGTEHREQIKSMITALGVTPPSIDGWDYAEAVGALTPVQKPASA